MQQLVYKYIQKENFLL